MAWLVAGLGNPGDRYERTRHNIGKLVVEELARSGDARLKKVRFLPANLRQNQTSVGYRTHAETFFFEIIFNEPDEIVFVLNDENFLRHVPDRRP